jgi:hypothetical protein
MARRRQSTKKKEGLFCHILKKDKKHQLCRATSKFSIWNHESPMTEEDLVAQIMNSSTNAHLPFWNE